MPSWNLTCDTEEKEKKKIIKEEEIDVTLEVLKNQFKYPGGQLSHLVIFQQNLKFQHRYSAGFFFIT